VEIARVIKDSVKQSLKSFHEEAQHSLTSTPERKLALIIDGRCLMYALDPTLRVDLLGLSLSCHSVVCCRVSPLQKAQVNNISWSTTFLLPTEELTIWHFVGNKPTHRGQKQNECFFYYTRYILINIHYTMDALTTLVGLYSWAYCVHSCTSEFWVAFSDVWSFCYQL